MLKFKKWLGSFFERTLKVDFAYEDGGELQIDTILLRVKPLITIGKLETRISDVTGCVGVKVICWCTLHKLN